MSAPESLALLVNGRSVSIAARTLADLVAAELGEQPSRGLAAALNGAVVPKRRWPETVLSAGDRVELVRVMNGG